MAGEIHYVAGQLGQASPSGRLDPPRLMALDEIVQTCPVPLPVWLADSGGKGIQLIPVAHGEAQLRTRWHQDGAQVVPDTCGVKIWLPGISDPATLMMASQLCGQACLRERGQDHHSRHDVMTPDMIRQLPAGYALIIRGHYSPVIARLGVASAPAQRPAWPELPLPPARLTELDQRETAHTAQVNERIDALTTLATAMRHGVDDQAEILAGLRDLDATVASLAARLDELAPPGDPAGRGYQPSPSPRFWKLDGQAREEAITRLRAWVEHVYQPGYGHLAGTLGSCWEQHPLCLYVLDWLSKLWSVLYLQPRRTTSTLAGQTEWQTRLLAAAAEQMAAETTRCEHTTLRTAPAARIRVRT